MRKIFLVTFSESNWIKPILIVYLGIISIFFLCQIWEILIPYFKLQWPLAPSAFPKLLLWFIFAQSTYHSLTNYMFYFCISFIVYLIPWNVSFMKVSILVCLITAISPGLRKVLAHIMHTTNTIKWTSWHNSYTPAITFTSRSIHYNSSSCILTAILHILIFILILFLET